MQFSFQLVVLALASIVSSVAADASYGPRNGTITRTVIPALKPTTLYATPCPPTTSTGGAHPGTATRHPQFTGAANANNVGGMMLGAVAGLAAFAL